jgi:carbon-monoxide dehydrogenase medium subunit
MWRSLDYKKARSVEEALALWRERPGARYLAGGTDLLPRARTSGQPPARLVDIKGIPELGRLEELPGGGLRIGASVCAAAVAAHPGVRARYPALALCASSLGSYPLRNRATVLGNICNASPCADTAAALLCLDAVVLARGPAGPRRVSIHELFVGPGQTCLEPGELATGLELPPETAGARAELGRLTRRQGVDISTVAVLLTALPGQGLRHRVALLSVAPTPRRVPEAENLLDQRGPAGADAAAELAMAASQPIDDVRGTAAYRREMVGVLLARAVRALSAA